MSDELGILRGAIVAAVESLELGDVDETAAILVCALEGGPSRPPVLLCPFCSLDCHWPGRLEEHSFNVHGQAA
jgi:hypothetical protein